MADIGWDDVLVGFMRNKNGEKSHLELADMEQRDMGKIEYKLISYVFSSALCQKQNNG